MHIYTHIKPYQTTPHETKSLTHICVTLHKWNVYALMCVCSIAPMWCGVVCCSVCMFMCACQSLSLSNLVYFVSNVFNFCCCRYYLLFLQLIYLFSSLEVGCLWACMCLYVSLNLIFRYCYDADNFIHFTHCRYHFCLKWFIFLFALQFHTLSILFEFFFVPLVFLLKKISTQ